MSTEREAIIRVENFTAAYNGQVVLEDVNFEVFTGEIFLSWVARVRARAHY